MNLSYGEIRNGAKLFYTFDQLGSVRELTDSTGKIRAQYDYDPYGRSIKLAGDLNSSFRYTGHYFHARSGLYLAPYRAYEPTLGRWLNRDPIGERGGVNLYGYVGGNPVNGVDPLGLSGQTQPIPTIPIFTIPIGSEQNIALSNALTQGLTDIADTLGDIIKQCKDCDPPEGTICSEFHEKGTPHKATDFEGNKLGKIIPHVHTWQMNKNPVTGVCHWNRRGDQKFTFNYTPVNAKPCSSYPSWVAQQGGI